MTRSTPPDSEGDETAPARVQDGEPRASRRAQALFKYVVSLADDALVLGHRLSEWSGHAPMLEEDIALSNLALDLIGQARLFYAYAGEIEGKGRDEDRSPTCATSTPTATCCWSSSRTATSPPPWCASCSMPRFMHPYYQALQTSQRRAARRDRGQGGQGDGLSRAPCGRMGDPARRRHRGEPRPRRGGAGRAVDVHGRAVRDGRGRAALVAAGIAVDREAIRPAWEATIDRVLAEATLQRPADALDADAAAAPAATASTWATCWPRCRCCTGRILA